MVSLLSIDTGGGAKRVRGSRMTDDKCSIYQPFLRSTLGSGGKLMKGAEGWAGK